VRILQAIIEGVKFRLVAYPAAVVEIGQSWWRKARPAVMFATEAFREFWRALWTGEIYPLFGTAIYDWRDGFLGFAGGLQQAVGRFAAAMVVTVFQAIRLALRWRWIGVPVMAAWFFKTLHLGGFLEAPIGNLVGFLAGKLFILTLPAAFFLLGLGFFRSRAEGVFPGLRAYFLSWIFRDAPQVERVNPVGAADALAETLAERVAKEMKRQREEEIAAVEAAVAARADAARAARLQARKK